MLDCGTERPQNTKSFCAWTWSPAHTIDISPEVGDDLVVVTVVVVIVEIVAVVFVIVVCVVILLLVITFVLLYGECCG